MANPTLIEIHAITSKDGRVSEFSLTFDLIKQASDKSAKLDNKTLPCLAISDNIFENHLVSEVVL
jgi:hypothetical protein